MSDHHQFPIGLFTRFPELERDVGSPFAGVLFIDAPSGAVQRRVDEIVRDVMRHRPTAPADGWLFYWSGDPPANNALSKNEDLLDGWSRGCERFLLVTSPGGGVLTYRDEARREELTPQEKHLPPKLAARNAPSGECRAANPQRLTLQAAVPARAGPWDNRGAGRGAKGKHYVPQKRSNKQVCSAAGA
jgi:hypothetical protein